MPMSTARLIKILYFDDNFISQANRDEEIDVKFNEAETDAKTLFNVSHESFSVIMIKT